MKKLKQYMLESLRIALNDNPEDDYTIEDFVDNTVFTFTFWVRSDGSIRVTFNWVIISNLEIQSEGNYAKAKLSGYNQNANVMASYTNSPITFINPDNTFIAMFRRDKIFNDKIDSTIFFNPKFNNNAINFLKYLLKSKTPGFGNTTISNVLNDMGVDGSDYEQFIGKDYDLEGEIHTKKVILRDIISHLGMVKESLRIGINDYPKEDYEYPSGNIAQLDQKVIDLLKYDINCLKPYLQRQNKNTLENLSQVLNQKMGGRDLRDNNGERKDVIMDLSKHIIENMFNNSMILYIFNDNMESDNVGEELGNDFFNLFSNCQNTDSNSTCHYYLGNDIAMISYRRGIYNYKDFDIFIIRKGLDLN